MASGTEQSKKRFDEMKTIITSNLTCPSLSYFLPLPFLMAFFLSFFFIFSALFCDFAALTSFLCCFLSRFSRSISSGVFFLSTQTFFSSKDESLSQSSSSSSSSSSSLLLLLLSSPSSSLPEVKSLAGTR